ncbi:MAG: sterol desaturase family protein [Nitrospinaceae bacterium]
MGTLEMLMVGLVGFIFYYYVVTFVLWFSHWFSHQSWSPFRSLHVLGHHVIYPNSRQSLSTRFHYSRGKHDSNFSFLPWLTLLLAMEYFLLPRWLFIVCFINMIIVVFEHGMIHLQFHLIQTPLSRFRWFARAREIHFVHHDLDKNFGIADHFWDRIFGSYFEPIPLSQEKSK